MRSSCAGCMFIAHQIRLEEIRVVQQPPSDGGLTTLEPGTGTWLDEIVLITVMVAADIATIDAGQLSAIMKAVGVAPLTGNALRIPPV